MGSISNSSQLEEQATGMAALARELQTKISSVTPDDIFDPDTLSSLEEHLSQMALMKRLPAPILSEVDEAGTALWNTCSQAMGNFAKIEVNLKILVRARVMAFGLLELAASSTSSGHLRALKLAVAAARSCVETEQLPLGLQILGAGAVRLEALKTSAEPIAPLELNSIAVEFHSLRARIASLQNRWDIAEHLFFKLPLTSYITNREIIAEGAFNIGCDALVTFQSETAVKWLERALEQVQMLAAQQGQASNPENLDLHIRHALVRAYLETKTPRAWEKLKEQMEVLKRDYDITPAVLCLELEIIRLGPKPDVDTFFKALRTIIQRLEFNDQNLEMIHAYIKLSKRLSLGLALDAHQSLLLHLPTDRRDWIQESFLRYVYLVTSMTTDSQLLIQAGIDAIQETAVALKERGFLYLDREVAHAILISIWGRVDDAMRKNRYRLAAKWCHLVVDNEIFRNISIVNKRKILRKLFTIALKFGDNGLAQQMMHKSVNRTGDLLDPIALFLSYKLGLLEEKDIFEYVSACIYPTGRHLPFEPAQFKVGTLTIDRQCDMVGCIRKVINQTQAGTNFDEKPTAFEKYLFPLFLLTGELRKAEYDERKFDLTVRIIRLASSEKESTLQDKGGSLTAHELEWIAGRSYHLARILLQRSQIKPLESLVDAMQELASAYSKDLASKPALARELNLFIPYLRLVVQGICTRALTEREEKRKHFQKLSEYIKEFRKTRRTNSDWYEFTSGQVVSALELETAIVLEDWTAFESFFEVSIKQAIGFHHTGWAMDTLLSFELPIKHRVSGVKLIIYSLFERAYLHPDRRKDIPRYLRILFDLCMSGATSDPQPIPFNPTVHDPPERYLELAEAVIDQALQTAADEAYLDTEEHRAQHAHFDTTNEMEVVQCAHYLFPAQELEHLATVAFNQAMDFYKVEKDKECRRWANKAIRLAEAMGDDESGGEAGEGVKPAGVFRKRLNEVFRGVR